VSPTSAEHVLEDLGHHHIYILQDDPSLVVAGDGGSGGGSSSRVGIESTVLKLDWQQKEVGVSSSWELDGNLWG